MDPQRALSIALIQLPSYREINPTLATSARHVIREVLAEHRHAGSPAAGTESLFRQA